MASAMETAMSEEHPDFDEEGYLLLQDVPGIEGALRIKPPNEDRIGLMMSRLTAKKVSERTMARFINVIVECMDDDSAEQVEDLMWEAEGEFGVEELLDVWARMVEVLAARPTQESTGSTRSQPSGGKKSTVRASRRASTSQRSRQTGSATSSTPGS